MTPTFEVSPLSPERACAISRSGNVFTAPSVHRAFPATTGRLTRRERGTYPRRMLLIPADTWEIRGRAFSSDDYGKGNRGIFATQTLRAGTIIGDYLGLLIPNERESEYETGKDLYLMYYDEHVSIWPDVAQPGVHIVNH